MHSDHIKRGLQYEKRKAAEHRAHHIGGPGNPDYQRGKVFGEVKCRQTKVTKPELQRLVKQKSVREVDSKAGFTRPAVEYRNTWRSDVKLIQRRRRI